MNLEWKELPRGDFVGQWSALYVTLNQKGHIVMNRQTYQRMGEPRMVVILVDAMNNRIGLRPAGKGARNGYPIGPYGRHGGRIIRAYRLLTEYGIKLPQTLQFHDAEIDQDGILVLDLRSAKVSSRARGQSSRRQSNSPE